MKPIDPRTRKMLMTIRAALIMASKAIEEYCKDDTSAIVQISASDSLSSATKI